MNKDEKYIKNLIILELEGNLSVLIDPKKKDSFSKPRINTWINLVADRIYHYVKINEEQK
jgi:hypothetical protein